jgi:phosphatidylglycerophosphatase A
VIPGTFGSALGIPLLLGLAKLSLSPAATVAIVGAAVVAATVICQHAGRIYAEADSSHIVLDEICGMLVAGALIAPTAGSLALVFVLFRALDVVKPFPASYFDRRMKNGLGVVADDVVAGVYTNLLVRVLV